MNGMLSLKNITIFVWTIIVLSSMYMTHSTQRKHSMEIARDIAKANFDKDQSFRRWASTHGGVYVPVDMKRTPPSPYLAHLPHRDVTTQTGKKLTLMNPAYMLRQMMEEYSGLYGAKGHITALDMLNPKSKPDAWETKALKRFKTNPQENEITEVVGEGMDSKLRMIRPMENKPSCLKCHAHQKIYQGTKTAGGVSVTIPLKEILTQEKESFDKSILGHIIFWLIGIIAFIFVFAKEKKAKDEADKLLQESIEQNNIIKLTNRLLDEKAKELKISSKYKSEFLANMSHEIRTPLNAITGFVKLLKDRVEDEKSKEYIDVVDESSKLLLHIIEDILDFSKIESGKLVIDKIDFNILNELSLTRKLFEAKCGEKNIALELEIQNNMPEYINADSLRIKQVISNLLSNAVKFTQEGKSIVILASYEDDSLLISVKDEGKGIAENKLKHIFDSFNQEDNSTTRKFGGTGLGLTISRELVSLMGGELHVDSQEGIGSRFYFKIPASIAEVVEEEIVDTDTASFKGKKILLVEDNKSNQMLMNIILDEMDIEVDIAGDGVIGVESFKNNEYDLILMDENMPNMNGIEATELILKYEQENDKTHTPIVALTANALKGDRQRFLDAGMDEYLSKPINADKLVETLKKVL